MTESYETITSWLFHGGETVKENLLRRSVPEPNSGCWLWMEGCSGDGYGAVNIRRKVHKAHRLSYMVFKGPVPDGMNLLHKCDNRLCINPDHLMVGTLAENNWDRDRKGRTAKGEKSGSAKLTREQIEEIRATPRTYPFVLGYRVLAAKYGVTFGHISKIMRKEAWVDPSESQKAPGPVSAFDEWFNGQEGYALRSERFDGDVGWLKAAFEAGSQSLSTKQPMGEILEDANFLIERLDDFERGSLSDSIEDACRDFDGHVSPAIERLLSALHHNQESGE